MKKFEISNLSILQIHDAYSFKLPQDTEGRTKLTHSALILKKGGRSEYYCDGKKLIADKDNALYIPANVEYSMCVERAGDCTVIEFDACGDASVPCSFFIGGDKEIFATARTLIQYWKLKGPAYRSKVLAELYTLITQISTAASFADSLAGKYPIIHKSVKYIEANYAKADLYTPDLAKMSGIGQTYYRNIFISVFSVPPAKYIQNYRVEKAKELLVNSQGSIEDIAIAVGFANSSYFCKVFKATTGMTPMEFASKGKKLG